MLRRFSSSIYSKWWDPPGPTELLRVYNLWHRTRYGAGGGSGRSGTPWRRGVFCMGEYEYKERGCEGRKR